MSARHPSSPSPGAEHARHDALLIAQQVAGDPVEPAQAREAAQLIATCRACAELAADLRTVSRAVAWEPIPPRRRDFRIDAVRAEQLRGSAWSRLLRRFAMPQARALRPLAAGVMSLGLVLVIAGNAWPSAAPSTSSQPVLAPIASPNAPPRDVVTSAAPDALPPTELTVEAPAAVQDRIDDESIASSAQAPDAGRDVPMQELHASEAKATEAPSRGRDASLVERADAAPDDGALSDTAAGAVGGLDVGSVASALAEPSGAAGPALEEAAPVEAGDAYAVAPADGDAGNSGATVDQELKASTIATTDQRSLDVESLLVWIGVGLALLGAVLLVLGWLSRRAADPLLR